MMRRILVLSLLGSIACSSESGGEAPSKQPKDAVEKPTVDEQPVEKPAEPVEKPAEPSEKPVAELPDHMGNQVVTITAELARSKGLPPLGFSLDFTGTAFSVSPFSNEGYLYASGPPGGPLGLRVSPIARNGELPGTKPKPEEIEVLGAKRPAVAWITGESLARTSWCAFVVAPEVGDDALLIELGVGHGGDEVTCKTALGHDELAKVIASLRFE